MQNNLISRSYGWVGSAKRQVEIWSAPPGILLQVEGGSDVYIGPGGYEITLPGRENEPLEGLDREIFFGPVMILALAMRNIWSLHSSAAMYKENVIVFLGESGQGKSTLAAYLSQNEGWRLVADDILPVKKDADRVSVLPHFPQLKLPVNAQPAIGLAEQLPLKYICVLARTAPDQKPELQKLSTAQAVQALLCHIAGTRMFNPTLLAQHLEFSAQAGKQIPAYRLIHPHRRDTLPFVREFFEKLC